MQFTEIVDLIGKLVDFVGVAVILIGVVLAISQYITAIIVRVKEKLHPYDVLRYNLGRTILLGLEFLVAGDIIRSIAGPATINTVIVLGLIVLIRAFLSWEFEKRTQDYYLMEKRINRDKGIVKESD